MAKQKLYSGFSLVELMIVAAILGILAAIIIPEFQSHSFQAKEVAARNNLCIVRNSIEIYTIQHNGFGPGYFESTLNVDDEVVEFLIKQQLTTQTIETGASYLVTGTPLGPYLNEFPENPINAKDTIGIVRGSFPVDASGTYGWIYNPSTREIRLDATGTDMEGNPYYSY